MGEKNDVLSRSPMRDIRTSRIVVCHEWLTTCGGSEKVASAIADVVEADQVFAYVVRPETASRLFDVPVDQVGPRGDFWKKHWQWLLPLMPRAWRRLDLSDFHLVFTSSHSCVNSVRPPEGAQLVSYVHSPIRYGWDWQLERGRLPRPLWPLWPAFAAWLRRQDKARSRNVDLFIANSQNVARRIATYYGRPSLVVYPPIDTGFWSPGRTEKEDFFLFAGRLVAYKDPALAVRAAAAAGRRLVVAGSGPELGRLRRMGSPLVSFVEEPSDEELRDLYRKARALVITAVEDLGMTALEAQACGTPVIGRRAGGILETVVPDVTGTLLEEPFERALVSELRSFDHTRFDPQASRANAERFSGEVFRARIGEVMDLVIRGQSEQVRNLPGWHAIT